jgi:hypothetical protein
MEELHELLSALGLKFSAIVAGLAGGLVSLLAEKQKDWKRAVVMLIVGALTAGYVTPLVSLHMHFNTDKFDPGNSLAFLVGLISMRAIDLIMSAFVWIRNNPTAVINLISKYFKKGK